MTLPDDSRYQIWKSQEIWDWMLHPPQNGADNAKGGSVRTPPPYGIGLKRVSMLVLDCA